MSSPVRTPVLAAEVGTLDHRLDRLRRVGWILDNSVRIPGTRIRFGVDAIIGLVPGLGDLIAGGLSLYIIAQAAKLGVPRALLARMGWNVAVDTLVGEVPILGDLFDVAWKANMRNLRLLEDHLGQPVAGTKANRGFVVLLCLGLLLLTVGAITAAVFMFRFFDGMLRGGLIG
ncbi:MAG: DUF4112 domain-containing protein [Gemmatimonadales bacterium]